MSKGKDVSTLLPKEVKEEEKKFLKDSYPGLMGSPVQVTATRGIRTNMRLKRIATTAFSGCHCNDQLESRQCR